jgi:hypothetical protein
MLKQRVGKRHRRSAAADHEIVRFELFVDHSRRSYPTRRKAGPRILFAQSAI